MSQIDSDNTQQIEGVASQPVTSGTVGTFGWDKRVIVRFITAGCFQPWSFLRHVVVGASLMFGPDSFISHGWMRFARRNAAD